MNTTSATDPLDIPDFLRVENRGTLTPEQEARLAEVTARAQPPRTLFARRSPEDQAAHEAALEEVRQEKIAAMKRRLANPKRKPERVPTGAAWDARTSRWVLPGQEATTPRQLIQGAAQGPTTRQIMDTIREGRAMKSAASGSNTTKPNFGEMSGPGLLAEYNKLSPTKRKAKFSDRAQGVAACERAWEQASPEVRAAAAAGGKVSKEIRQSTQLTGEAPKVSVAKPPEPPSTGAPRAEGKARSAKLAMRITIVTQKNPRREGTDAHRHYEAMRGGPTVSEYLERFSPEDRRTAAQWLSNTVRDGHVKVVENKTQVG